MLRLCGRDAESQVDVGTLARVVPCRVVSVALLLILKSIYIRSVSRMLSSISLIFHFCKTLRRSWSGSRARSNERPRANSTSPPDAPLRSPHTSFHHLTLGLVRTAQATITKNASVGGHTSASLSQGYRFNGERHRSRLVLRLGPRSSSAARALLSLGRRTDVPRSAHL